MSRVLQRLRQRKIGQWAIAYILVAVGVYELLGNVAGNFGWPAFVLRAATVLLAVGFLATLVIAWYHGEKGHQRVTLIELFILGTLLLIAAALTRMVWPASPAGDGTGAGSAARRGLMTDTGYDASVAVLPPENITGDPADDRLGVAIVEEIVSTLSRIAGLKVIDRNSAASAMASGGTLGEIASRLGVAHVVTSSLRRVGDQMRIVVHLVDPATETYLWNQTFRPAGRDPFAVQDSIAMTVAEKLALTVDGATAGHAHQPDTAAYDAYLSGQSWLHQRTRAGLGRAMESFASAIAFDPSYARAYAALSSAYVLWVTYDYDSVIDHYASYGAALALADRAVAIDPDLADGYLARGFVLSKSWAPAQQAESDFETALRLLPGSADVHGWYAHLLAREGRHAEALAAARRAIDLDPLAPGRDVG
ncbi:MAG: hypothetical protein L0271_11680, partial [Gemmatimonadetes bacterium]|nr:hypothetical protein [Gemmatimonadota bacterium]